MDFIGGGVELPEVMMNLKLREYRILDLGMGFYIKIALIRAILYYAIPYHGRISSLKTRTGLADSKMVGWLLCNR